MGPAHVGKCARARVNSTMNVQLYNSQDLSSTSGESEDVGAAMWAGIGIAVAALVCVACVAFAVLRRRRRNRSHESSERHEKQAVEDSTGEGMAGDHDVPDPDTAHLQESLGQLQVCSIFSLGAKSDPD